MPSESQSTAESTSTPAPKQQKTHGKLMTILNDFLQCSDNITDPTEKVKVEMQRYMADVITDQYYALVA